VSDQVLNGEKEFIIVDKNFLYCKLRIREITLLPLICNAFKTGKGGAVVVEGKQGCWQSGTRIYHVTIIETPPIQSRCNGGNVLLLKKKNPS